MAYTLEKIDAENLSVPKLESEKDISLGEKVLIIKNKQMKIFTIEENDANGRLDKFLKKLFPSASISLIYKLNRKDKIKIKFE